MCSEQTSKSSLDAGEQSWVDMSLTEQIGCQQCSPTSIFWEQRK